MIQPLPQIIPPTSSLPTIFTFGRCLETFFEREWRPLALIVRKTDNHSIGVFIPTDAWSGAARAMFANAKAGVVAARDRMYDVWVGKLCERLAAGETLLAVLVAPTIGKMQIVYVQDDPVVAEPTQAAVESAVTDVIESLPLLKQEKGSQRTH